MQLSGAELVLPDMESETLRSRIAALVQKSRKALRLYSSMGRLSGGETTEFGELQVAQWREITSDLLRDLTAALDHPNARTLAGAVLSLRDKFYADWRRIEADLKVKQQELIAVAEHGDFIKAAHVSRALVVLKAREQAAQAAHHELQDVVKKSRLVQPTIELSGEAAVSGGVSREAEPDGIDLLHGERIRVGAKIIPLRK